MPILIAILGGAGFAYWLIETELALPVFIAYWVFVILLFVWPTMAWWMLGLSLLAAALLVLAAMWETVLGIILGVFMFLFLIAGLIHAL